MDKADVQNVGTDEKAGSVNGVRRLRKVQYAYYDHGSDAPHPVIRIAGRYLEKFGFRIGDTITVVIGNGAISISKLSESESNYLKKADPNSPGES
jgi:hypothetical protein